ncbi:unnamed protein product, partial [Meganyctiphanes norvegica]
GIEGNVTELEEKRRFLENSVQNIQISKSSSDILNIYEDVKRKLQLSQLCRGDAKESLNLMPTIQDSQPRRDDLQPRTVRLVKTDNRVGITWTGGSEINLPIYILKIIPGTAAHGHGALKPGDRLLNINGVSMENKSQTYAAELLRSPAEEVILEVRYEPAALEEIRRKYKIQ